MVRKYIAELAKQTGLPAVRVSIVEGQRVGCLDVHLLHLSSEGQRVSALVYQSELDELNDDYSCERLEVKILNALKRLKTQL